MPLLSEPKRQGADGVYVMDSRKDTAARVFNTLGVANESRGQGVGHLWVQVNGLLLVSTYVSPNASRP